MIETLLSIFAAPGLGALFGTVGSWLTKREERETLKVDNEHKERMAKINSDNRIAESKIEGELADQKLSGQAFLASQESEAVNSGSPRLDGIRKLMRPIITVFLLVIMSIITYQLHTITGGLKSLPADQTIALYRDIIFQILFLVTTAVTWWFGSRPTSKS